MQNKILSLKEIDQLDAYYEIRCSDEGDFEISRYNMKSLIATARAYHEKLKEEAMESVSRCCGATMGRSFSGGLICDHCCQSTTALRASRQAALKEAERKGYEIARRETEDKPHPATIKVMIEAFKVMRRSNAGVGHFLHVVSLDNGTYYLESIHKDLWKYQPTAL